MPTLNRSPPWTYGIAALLGIVAVIAVSPGGGSPGMWIDLAIFATVSVPAQLGIEWLRRRNAR